MESLEEFLEIHPEIRSGVPVLRGTRFPVSMIFAEIADGRSIDEIVEDFDIDREKVVGLIRVLSNILNVPFCL